MNIEKLYDGISYFLLRLAILLTFIAIFSLILFFINEDIMIIVLNLYLIAVASIMVFLVMFAVCLVMKNIFLAK